VDAAVRGWLLVALTLGLAASITLSELTLVVLAAWLAFGPRETGARRVGWPLLGPLAAFAAWTLVATLAAPRPAESLVARRACSRWAPSTLCATHYRSSERPSAS